MGANCVHGLALADRLLKYKFLRGYPAMMKIPLGSPQRLHIAQRQTELMLIAMLPAGSLVVIRRQQGITTNNAAEIPQLVITALLNRGCESPRAHEFVAGREIRPLHAASPYEASDKFPSALGKKPMV